MSQISVIRKTANIFLSRNIAQQLKIQISAIRKTVENFFVKRIKGAGMLCSTVNFEPS